MAGAIVATLVHAGLPSATFRATANLDAPSITALGVPPRDTIVSGSVVQRAATSLIGTGEATPQPTLADRAAVTVGIAPPAGRVARLAEALRTSVAAVPGPGVVSIVADNADAAEAARIATAVAEAVVADQADRLVAARRDHEIAAARRLDILAQAVQTAHERLLSYGAFAADPEQARAAAAEATRAAEARLAAFRSIIASGAPPLADRKDVPQSIETLQSDYLDRARQLAKARETLGDLHTTVIGLQDGLRTAARALTAEWKRLESIAESDARQARQREVAARKPESPADARRRAAAETARLEARAADEALSRAQTERGGFGAEDRPFRLQAPAAIPLRVVGFSDLLRAAVALVAGLLAAGAVIVALPVRRRERRVPNTLRVAAPAPPTSFFEAELEADKPPVLSKPSATHPSETPTHEDHDMSQKTSTPASRPDADLEAAMREIAAGFQDLEAGFGPVPTVFVAANEHAAGTTKTTLALGIAAAELGARVLLVEAPRARPDLAAAVARDGEPILVDAFGALRVVLPAEGCEGLYLAPHFAEGSRIAAALARNAQAPLVDDIAADFDLILVDGGRAADSAQDGWSADAYLRVARFASVRDDEYFLETVAADADAFVGTLTGAGFVPKPKRRPTWRAGIERELPRVGVTRPAAPGRFAAPPSPGPRLVEPERNGWAPNVVTSFAARRRAVR